ncbi:MAG TPA: S41 family peptidase [Flavitalea sp.]|nr:S41 family peptidase [Flavitalea sp.]
MKKIQVWLPLLFAIVMVTGMWVGYTLRSNVPLSREFLESHKGSSLQEVMELVNQNYVDPVSTDTLTEDAVQAMLAHLDPHSVFIPAVHLREVNEDLQGNFQGIGVEFHIISDTVHVISVLMNGPSDQAGLHVGDRFLKVSDSVVAGNHITVDRIKNLLRGPGGSKVSVTLLRDKTVIPATITRGTIPLYSVDAAYMIDAVTGFIHLNKFSGTSYEEFMQAVEKLNKEGMKKLIFDLRDNGGGILSEAVDISDEFLDADKLIVFTKGDKQPKIEYRCKRPGLFEKGRLIVLVDEGSASASEVVAGALQDWDRATIIGRRTFGKGLVQEQFNLSNGAALRLTVARYYTPTGRSIQKPYVAGRDAYNEEVATRFQNGEVLHPDSVFVEKGPAFKTTRGKTVYGGGGITPDIFVPFDTTGFTGDLSALFYDQAFGKFIYRYYIQHKNDFDQYKNPADFSIRYTDTKTALNDLFQLVGSDSLRIENLSEHDQTELEKRIKTWLARQIWRMDGYYQVNNSYDEVVRRALDELKRN